MFVLQGASENPQNQSAERSRHNAGGTTRYGLDSRRRELGSTPDRDERLRETHTPRDAALRLCRWRWQVERTATVATGIAVGEELNRRGAGSHGDSVTRRAHTQIHAYIAPGASRPHNYRQETLHLDSRNPTSGAGKPSSCSRDRGPGAGQSASARAPRNLLLVLGASRPGLTHPPLTGVLLSPVLVPRQIRLVGSVL
ncbi:unnamed protein product [Lampetra fluviatilis]